MSRDKTPVTATIRELRAAKAEFTEHPYDYEDKGGTAVSARELGVPEHAVVKTLIMQDDAAKPLIVLMHGDRKVSTKELARNVGVKSIAPCNPETAYRHSGDRVGVTSPFGTSKQAPLYMEQGILDLPRIYINGGRRGYLVGRAPQELLRIVRPELVKVGIEQP